jgi:penicillin-binding protein 1A
MGTWREAVDSWQELPEWSRWTALAAAGGVAVAVTSMLVVPWIAERTLVARAEERGLVVEVAQTRLGFGRLWFRGVQLRDPALPSLTVRLDAIEVRPTLGRGASASVHGGFIDAGEVSEERLRARWRELVGAGKAPEPATPATRARRAIEVNGVGLAWLDGKRAKVRLWGGRFEQRSRGDATVAVDLLRVSARRLSAEVTGVQGELGSDRRLTSLEVASVAARVDLADDATGPEVKGTAMDPGDREETRGTWSERLAVLGAAIRPLTSETFRGSVSASSVEFARGDEALAVGPSRIGLTRDRDALALELVPNAAGPEAGTPLSLKAHVPFAGTFAELELAGGPVGLSALGVREGDFGLIGVRETRLEARAELKAQDFSHTELSSKGVLENLRLRRAALAPGEISAARLGWRFEGTLAESVASLKNMELSLGDLRVQLSGEVSLKPEHPQADVRVSVPLAACNALLGAVPRGMAPLTEAIRAEGTFSLEGSLYYDSQKVSATRVGLRVDNQCKIREVPAAISANRFRGPWLREVKAADGSPMTIESGPSTPDWTQYEDISPFMETAVLVCEDGHFFTHHGFDYNALENSVRMNLESGRFLRGGSTVSMQLAKNLYLSKEKTISRKLQEAVLTMLLEQQLSKHEIMELYLNIIEFGPGIYGVRQAAHYYFNEEAHDLSLGQALYLASILPSPDVQHFLPDGRVSDGWTSYLQKLMRLAKKIHRISDEELSAGLAERVQFRSPNQLARLGGSPEDEDGAARDDERESEP